MSDLINYIFNFQVTSPPVGIPWVVVATQGCLVPTAHLMVVTHGRLVVMIGAARWTLVPLGAGAVHPWDPLIGKS